MNVRAAIPSVLDRRLGRTRAALGLVVRRRDSAVIAATIAIGYLGAFLWAGQDLVLRTDASPSVVVVRNPLELVFQRTGPASFEAIAIVDTGVVRLLFSPGNVAIGMFIAGLVGISFGLTYLAVIQPKACGIGTGSGFLASVPALLSGSVCCGPVILFALGIQATGLLMTAFVWLLPVGILALVGSVVYLAGKIDVTQAAGSGA